MSTPLTDDELNEIADQEGLLRERAEKAEAERDRYRRALEEILGDVGYLAAHPIARTALNQQEES